MKAGGRITVRNYAGPGELNQQETEAQLCDISSLNQPYLVSFYHKNKDLGRTT